MVAASSARYLFEAFQMLAEHLVRVHQRDCSVMFEISGARALTNKQLRAIMESVVCCLQLGCKGEVVSECCGDPVHVAIKVLSQASQLGGMLAGLTMQCSLIGLA